MKVAVFGASGTIGQALLPILAENHEVVAVSRHSQGDDQGISWRVADVTDLESLSGPLEGIGVVYYLVHSLGVADYAKVDRRAAKNVAIACSRAGVQQIVFMGGLGDDSRDLSEHLRSRRETEEVLSSGDVPVTTLRAGVVIGKGSAGFETITALVDRLPIMITPRWVKTETQPIALTDVVHYLQGVCGSSVTYGRSFDIGGPEVMTYGQMISQIAAIKGKRPRLINVPLLTPRLSSYWLHLVTPVTANIARPLIEGLRNTTVVTNHEIEDLIPIKRTSFELAVRQALT